MLLVIFFMVFIILFIVGNIIILLKKDKAIGGIVLAGSLIYLVLAILMLNTNFQIDKINRQASASTVKSSKNIVPYAKTNVVSLLH